MGPKAFIICGILNVGTLGMISNLINGEFNEQSEVDQIRDTYLALSDEGYYETTKENALVHYEGRIFNRRPFGKGILTFSDGKTMSTYFHNSKPSGDTLIEWSSGAYLVGYMDIKGIQGDITYVNSNGSKYTGEMFNGVIRGDVTKSSPDLAKDIVVPYFNGHTIDQYGQLVKPSSPNSRIGPILK